MKLENIESVATLSATFKCNEFYDFFYLFYYLLLFVYRIKTHWQPIFKVDHNYSKFFGHYTNFLIMKLTHFWVIKERSNII